jgi:prepilin-type N-terminal cleavage/methylation domain-containing protein/prepilin-type processing-associated H-X9-DG protein
MRHCAATSLEVGRLMKATQSKINRAGFTLVELLVVIGIIAVLFSLLLPAVSRARQQANSVVCESNLQQIGASLLTYADIHDGWLYPPDMGWDPQHVTQDAVTKMWTYNVWPTKVWGIWNPAWMLCPSDVEPAGQHSYVLNEHVAYWNIKYSTVLPPGKSHAQVILMGEKHTTVTDYYMQYGDFNRVVEPYRHGQFLGSNYLMLDLHVETQLPSQAILGLDPWDFNAGLTPPTVSGGGS